MSWKSGLVIVLLCVLVAIYAPMLVEQHDRQYPNPTPTAGCTK